MARGLWAVSLAAMGLSILGALAGLIMAVVGFPIDRVVGTIAASLALYGLGVNLSCADWRRGLRQPPFPTSREVLQQEVARARAERARRAAELAMRRRGSGTGRGAA